MSDGFGRFRSLVFAVLLASLLLGISNVPPARADFILPDGATLPFQNWSRGAANSLYAEWDVFSVPFGQPGNAPDVGSSPSAAFAAGSDARVFGNEPAAFLTGGGNIYSFSAITDFTATAPAPGKGAGWNTRYVAQIRTLGSLLDVNSLQLSYAIGAGETSLSPTFYQELDSIELGGFGGTLVDHLVVFDIGGFNPSGFRLDFNAAESSMSLDRLAVDTFTTTGALAPLVPGGGGWAVDADGAWSAPGNWQGPVPGGAGSTALFGPVITAPRTVANDSPHTIGHLLVRGDHPYTITGPAQLTLEDSSSASLDIDAASTLTITAPLGIAAGVNVARTGEGTLTIAGLQNHATGARLTLSGGMTHFQTDAGSNLSLAVNARATFEAAQHLGALAIGPAGAVQISPGGNRSLGTTMLEISPGGMLDLADHAAIVQAGTDTRVAVLDQVTAWIASGSHALAWDGPGIRSGVAAADPASLTAIGVMLNDDGAGGAFRSQFAGQPVDANSVLVRYTYYGDADLSGAVDGTDYALIDNGFNAGLMGWFNGDFDYSGRIDGTDYALIDNAFNAQSGPLAATVPEPESWALAVLTILLTICVRKRALPRPILASPGKRAVLRRH